MAMQKTQIEKGLGQGFTTTTQLLGFVEPGQIALNHLGPLLCRHTSSPLANLRGGHREHGNPQDAHCGQVEAAR